MKIKYTNFEGNWDELCPFCGKPNRDHQVNLGDNEGKRHIHRQPCAEEQHHIRKKAVKQGIATRVIIQVYDICTYLWGKIPLKEELKFFYGFVKNIFINARALFYLMKKKPK